MKQIDLNGLWQLCQSAPGAGDAQRWYQAGIPTGLAIQAQVPGDVHLDLIRAGCIKEPLFGKNVFDCQWVEACDWWYMRTFTVEKNFLAQSDQIELYASGLDLTAQIWLNGEFVGSHNNQFIPAAFNVSDIIRPGENMLVIRMDVGLQAAPNDRRRYIHISDLPASGLPRMWMRKAQFSFGWDWAPRLLTCGIWRPIFLRSYKQIAIRSVYIVPHLETKTAIISIQIEIESFAVEKIAPCLTVEIRGNEIYSQKTQIELQPGVNLIETEVSVPDPVLWWPRSLGQPYLYDFYLELKGEEILDCYETQFGIRKVSLLQEPLSDDEGISFTININDQPVFCKGANWVPADSIPARVTEEKYKSLIAAAAECNFNMFRVWGGGIYEDPYFYHLCDQAGIMVWQDFMFACSLYPDDDPEFCQAVGHEARTIIKQLRNHPSIVLWCGNNENDWIYLRRVHTGWELPIFYGGKIYHEILPSICKELDPFRPYWPSSPYGGDEANSELIGDRHHWDVPIGIADPVERVNFYRWAEDRGKFISEYGFLSPPVEESLPRFLPANEICRDAPSWNFHNNLFEKDSLRTCLQQYWQESEALSLEEYIMASQIIQAEALKFSLEEFRHRKFRTSGALFWMYSDCWGSISWSIVDYYLNKKPAFYYVRRALVPLLISFHEVESELMLWLTNDSLKDYECLVEYGILNLMTSASHVETIEVVSYANSARSIMHLPKMDIPDEQKRYTMPFAKLHIDGRITNSNRHFMTGFKFNELHIPQSNIQYHLEEVGDQQFRLKLESNAFAWAVRVKVPPCVYLEDNYFDLLPGQKYEIGLSGPALEIAKLQVGSMRFGANYSHDPGSGE